MSNTEAKAHKWKTTAIHATRVDPRLASFSGVVFPASALAAVVFELNRKYTEEYKIASNACTSDGERSEMTFRAHVKHKDTERKPNKTRIA